jgi:vacuolar protein sorting-associated protein 13A/C
LDLPAIRVNLAEKEINLIKSVLKTLSSEKDTNEKDFNEQVIYPSLQRRGSIEYDMEVQNLGTQKPEFESIVSQTILEFDLKLGSVSLLLKDSVPIALFQLSGFNIAGKLKENASSITTSLDSLVIKDERTGGLLITPVGQKVISGEFVWQDEIMITDLKLYPIVFNFERECVLRIYGFYQSMTSSTNQVQSQVQVQKPQKKTNMKVFVEIQSIELCLSDSDEILGIVVIKDIKTSFIDHQSTSINGIIGTLNWKSDLETILKIEQDDAFEFKFLLTPTKTHDSSLQIKGGSWRFQYIPSYIKKLSQYFAGLSKIQSFIDGGVKIAVEKTKDYKQKAGKINFQIKIKTPIVEIPNNDDRLVLYLGEITARSNLEPLNAFYIDRFYIDVKDLKVQSVFGNIIMSIIEDLTLNITHDTLLETNHTPDTLTTIKTSDINLKITNHQYRLLVDIFKLINAPSQENKPSNAEYLIFLSTIILEVYNTPTKYTLVDKFSLARFIANNGVAKLLLLENLLLELKFSSLSIFDTREKLNLFRDIMSPLEQGLEQFVLVYEVGENVNYDVAIDRGKVVLEVDHLLSIQRFAIQAWNEDEQGDVDVGEIGGVRTSDEDLVNSSFGKLSSLPGSIEEEEEDVRELPGKVGRPSLSGRNGPESDLVTTTEPNPNTEEKTEKPKILTGKVSFLEAEIVLIEDPKNAETDAVVLITKTLVITHSSIIGVSFLNLGMFFANMSNQSKTKLRFLDDCDLDFTWDSNTIQNIQKSHYFLETSKLLFRVSNQDIILLKSLTSRIVEGMSSGSAQTTITPTPVSQKFRLSMEGSFKLIRYPSSLDRRFLQPPPPNV